MPQGRRPSREARGQNKELAMLRIYDDMLDVLRAIRGAIEAIEKRDSDVARQLRRAASSVVLNIAEGSGSFGRVRTARYRTALGSGARDARVRAHRRSLRLRRAGLA